MFMKYSLFILLIIITFNISAANNWEIVSVSETNVIYDVFFINRNIGWFVSGFNTTVYKTTDNGNSWNMIYSSVSESRQCIQFLNEDKGYTGGFEYPPKNKKFINRNQRNWNSFDYSTDGGINWIEGNPVGPSDIYDIIFIDTLCGWSADAWGRIGYTSNGGDSWDQQYITNYSILKIIFVDSLKGWAVASDSLLRTTDGGGTWIADGLTGAYYRSVFFTDSLNGWIVGISGSIAYSSDGGLSWIEQNSQINNNLNDVLFINNNEGWAAGDNGKILYTQDGGSTWVVEQSNTTVDLLSIHFSDSTNGWISGEDGILLRRSQNNVEEDIEINQGLQFSFISSSKDKVKFRLLLPENSLIDLTIYDISGREIINLLSGEYQKGEYIVPFKPEVKGLYFYRLENEQLHESGKVIILE